MNYITFFLISLSYKYKKKKLSNIYVSVKTILSNKQNVCNKQIKRFFSSKPSASKYITTPIFYVNSVPHIGHLYTAVLADAIARYYAMNEKTKVLLTTGTDEHGNKVKKAAEKLKVEPSIYCSKISNEFKEMCNKFNIKYTDFIRTTETRHVDAVSHFWKVLQDKDYIYLGKYSGWYCTSDESFLSDKEIKEITNINKGTQKVSLESGNPVEWAEESNYKFRLSAFQDDLKHWLKDESAVQPSVFYKILHNQVEDPEIFRDFSISRPKARAPWGITTPVDDSQTIYVWFDALINYLTSVGYPNESFRQFWPPAVQVVGKDILKFHGIYWPALLIAAGLEPPKTLLVHSHWTINGEKMSKSKGNVSCPFNEAKLFTNEGLRYYLLRDSVPHNDGNFSRERVCELLNADLANKLGNLVNRCISKSINPNCEFPDPVKYAKSLSSLAAENLRSVLESLSSTAAKNYEQFYIHHVVDNVMQTLQIANQMVTYHKPWELAKSATDPKVKNELLGVISLALETARISSIVLQPIVPELSNNLLNFLKIPKECRLWIDTKPLYLNSESSESAFLNADGMIVFKQIRN